MCEAIFLPAPTSGPHNKQSPAWRLGGHSRARPAALQVPGSVLGLLSASLTPLTVPNTMTPTAIHTRKHTLTHDCMCLERPATCVLIHTRHGHYSY